MVRAANDELHTRVLGDTAVAASGAGRRFTSLANGSNLDAQMEETGKDGFLLPGAEYVPCTLPYVPSAPSSP